MSRRKWPWILLGLLLLAAGVGGGWILKSCTTSEMSSSSPTPTPSTETITVTIGDETVQIGSDKTGHIETGHKGSVKVPDAELEKLARTLRPPSPSLISTLVPQISALLVSFVALGGVLLAADKAAKTARQTAATDRQSDARSEWFRRFEVAQGLALTKGDDKDADNRKKLGVKLLMLHMESSLAGKEEVDLARTVLEQVMEPVLKKAGVVDPGLPAEPGQADVHYVVTDPEDL